MRKIALSIIAISTLVTAGEFRYGHGTFSMEGGFLGISNSIDINIDTYSMAERHSNILKSNFFYGYDFTWMDSKILKQMEKSYNNYIPSQPNLNIPAMNYNLQGLDANINLGYDFLHKGEGDFLGLSLLLGISIPWIDNSSDSNGGAGDIEGYYKDSKTKISTYKIGPSISFEKSIVDDKLSIYGLATYAYQTGNIKNDYAKFDSSVNGTYQEYNIGFRYTPFTENYKLGWFTLSPRVYATLGYKYSKWQVDDVVMDLSGGKFNSDIVAPLKTDFTMDSSVSYFGVGYSF